VVVKRSRLVMGRRAVMMVARSVLLFFLHDCLFQKIFRLGSGAICPRWYRSGLSDSRTTRLATLNRPVCRALSWEAAVMQSLYRDRLAPARSAHSRRVGGGKA
jgi:hypothetical protein